LTAKRPDYFLNGKRITGHVGPVKGVELGERVRKHRYIKILGDRRGQRGDMGMIKWEIVPEYPKRQEER